MIKCRNLFIVLVLLITSVCFADVAECTSAELWLSSFGYYDSLGNKVDTLTAGDEIVLRAEVKRSSDAPEATLIAEFFKDGEIFDLVSKTVSFEENEKTATISLPYTLPSDTAGLTLEAYLWNTYSEQIPVARPSEFGSDNAELAQVYIYGKPVDQFDEEILNYSDVALPASTGNSITEMVDVLCLDMGTKVTVTKEGNSLKLNSEALSGESKLYTIDYTVAEPQIISNELIYYNKTGTQQTDYQFPELKVLQLPVYQRDGDGKVIKFGTTANFNNNVSRVFNKLYYFYNKIPEELIGAPYIFTDRLNNMDYDNMTLKIKLNRSADVYFSASEVIALEQDATEYENWEQLRIINAGATGNAMREFVPDENDEGSDILNGPLYKKRLAVPEGDESKEFTLSVGNSDKSFGPTVIIKFADDTEE